MYSCRQLRLVLIDCQNRFAVRLDKNVVPHHTCVSPVAAPRREKFRDFPESHWPPRSLISGNVSDVVVTRMGNFVVGVSLGVRPAGCNR